MLNDSVQDLLDRGAVGDALNGIVACGYEDLINRMLEEGTFEWGQQDFLGRTPLHTAIRMGSTAIVRNLIERLEPNVFNQPNREGQVSLHLTIKFKKEDVATLLVEQLALVQDNIQLRTYLN